MGLSIAEMVTECVKRLRIEPTAPVDRVVSAVTYYYSKRVAARVKREVLKQTRGLHNH